MLQPALLYMEQLQEKQIATMYDMRYQYYTTGTGTYMYELSNNNEVIHELVSISDKEEILGFISYRIDLASGSCYNFGLMSFDIGNTRFALDAKQAIIDIFEKYKFNRVEWKCFSDNPAIRGYRNFIKRFGGREVGIYKQAARLMDGELHDAVCFEILREDYLTKRKGV